MGGPGDSDRRGDANHQGWIRTLLDNQSNAAACGNVSDPTCQATNYSIAAARYHQFSTMFAVTGCSGDTAHWSVSIDSVVVKSGTVAVNSSAQQIAVVVPVGNSLELLASTSSFSGAACGGVNIIWGNARLS